MNTLRPLAKIALGLLAVYMCIATALMFFQVLFYLLPVTDRRAGTALIGLATILSYVVITAVMIHQLVHNGDKWAQRIVEAEISEIPSPCDWLPGLYRIVSVSIGIFVLYWTLPQIFSILQMAHLSRSQQWGSTSYAGLQYWRPNLAAYVMRVLIGGYLVLGAPHFIKWQIKKTVEQCSEQADTEDDSTQC